MKKCIFIGSLIFFSSCGMGHLTTQQENELIKIDKELNKVWTNYQYKTDSLYIQRNKVYNQNNK
jgi:hypothetical protein